MRINLHTKNNLNVICIAFLSFDKAHFYAHVNQNDGRTTLLTDNKATRLQHKN